MSEHQLLAMIAHREVQLQVMSAHHVQALKEQGVEILLVPRANPEAYDNVPKFIVPARAAENGLTIAYVNYCGLEAGLEYGGRSTIVGPDGTALAQAGKGEVLLVADLENIWKLDARLLSSQANDRRIVV